MANVRIEADRKIYLGAFPRLILAADMFQKGKGFLDASNYLRRKRGHKDVVIYLLGLSVELFQKALLMAHESNSITEKKLFALSHDLVKGADELSALFQLKPLSAPARAELAALNSYYHDKQKKGALRYVGYHELFGGHNLSINHVSRRAKVLKRFGERFFNRRRTDPSTSSG